LDQQKKFQDWTHFHGAHGTGLGGRKILLCLYGQATIKLPDILPVLAVVMGLLRSPFLQKQCGRVRALSTPCTCLRTCWGRGLTCTHRSWKGLMCIVPNPHLWEAQKVRHIHLPKCIVWAGSLY